MANKLQVDVGVDREMKLTRVFDAPRALVWAAWTDPTQLAQWWGPRGFRADVTIDLRVGGAYAIVMLAPDGGENPMRGVFEEVATPSRLVMTVDCTGMPQQWLDIYNASRGVAGAPPRWRRIVTLEDAPGAKTLLTVRDLFEDQLDREAHVKLGAEMGWGESFERLDVLLGGGDHKGQPAMTITVVPHLVVDGAAEAIKFYEKAFGASCEMTLPSGDGKLMHASLNLNGGKVYLVDEPSKEHEEMAGAKSPLTLGGSSIVVHLEVPDVDKACERAVSAGAKVIMPVENMFWGDRYCKVRDPFGHVWSMSSPAKH
jgi:PhnB protein